MRNRSGQISMSFGTIFSIILIIAFIAFAVFAIIKFLDLQKTIQIEKFTGDFQNDVSKMWKSTQGSQKLAYSLPTHILAVCFTDDEFQNMQFNSAKGIIPGRKISSLDIVKTTETDDPFCIPNVKGKLSLTITKAYGETLVTVTR